MAETDQLGELPVARAGEGASAAPGADLRAFAARIVTTLREGDVVLALAVIAILIVLVMPMPRWLLDFSLALSITFSVLVLMVGLFIARPLEFSAFPTILLIATLLRLALNLASTRLILAGGHTGTGAAGKVIQAFGDFVMSGNFVIGIIVFAILVIVNFVVITKGSSRIAEVSARFSLDAMPGIDEAEARRRRRQLEDESTFFGAMDGAAKFVRGDAIAGLLITFINIVGGIVVGVAQHDMSFGAAADNYIVLTVGDGLVSQIPALIVSTAAGLLVSKAGVVGSADKAVFGQLGNHPKALGMVSGLMVAMSLLPGIPMPPFLLLAALTGFLGWRLSDQARHRTIKTEAEARAHAEAALARPAEEPIATALHIDVLRLELGYGLLPLINDRESHRLTEQIKALRRQLATDMGFVMPAVRIQDNMQLPANQYLIRVKDIKTGSGELNPNQLLVMDPRGEAITLPGQDTVEPTFGLPAKWVAESHREEALFRGYTVVDPATVITTHLTELVKDHMPELLSYAETQKLLDELDREHQKLVADLIPGQVPLGGIQRVLKNLLAERVSIRDLPTILEGISEALGYTPNLTLITEHVRARLARQVSHDNTSGAGYIPLLTLSPEWEQSFAESLVGQGEDKQLSMAPSRLQEFIAKVRHEFDTQAKQGEMPVLLTSPAIRPYVRSIVERFRPATVVMSQNEIHAKAKIHTLGQV
jgi:flagellar biosynthesis protein FlhA